MWPVNIVGFDAALVDDSVQFEERDDVESQVNNGRISNEESVPSSGQKHTALGSNQLRKCASRIHRNN